MTIDRDGEEDEKEESSNIRLENLVIPLQPRDLLRLLDVQVSLSTSHIFCHPNVLQSVICVFDLQRPDQRLNTEISVEITRTVFSLELTVGIWKEC